MKRIDLPVHEPCASSSLLQPDAAFEPDESHWTGSACYRFDQEQVERDIIGPCAELEEMCFDVVAEAVRSEEIMERLAIPAAFHDYIRTTWEAQDRHLYGRFDLSYDGRGPARLLEYNADSATMLRESGAMQADWLNDATARNIVSDDCRQFNRIDEYLVEAFRNFGIRGRLHLAASSIGEDDVADTLYVGSRAEQAGLETVYLPIENIGMTDTGQFVDEDDEPIETLFRIYPWDFIMRDPFGAEIPASGTRFIEPAWRTILAGKGLLALLWDRFTGHPGLLPAFFDDDSRARDIGARVRKPLWSRQGDNVELVSPDGVATTTDGPYGDGGHVVQALHPLPRFGELHAVCSCWMIASRPAGLAVREEKSPVTTDNSCFIPHVVCA